MTEVERLEVAYKEWRKQSPSCNTTSKDAFKAGWLAATENALRMVAELKDQLSKPKH